MQHTTKNWISSHKLLHVELEITNKLGLDCNTAGPCASKFNGIIQLAYKEYCAETSIISLLVRSSVSIYIIYYVPLMHQPIRTNMKIAVTAHSFMP